MYPEQCIPHALTCSQYPSPGQRRDLELAEADRKCDIARETEQRLASLGYTSATARFGTVVLDADDAARLVECIDWHAVER
jgi:hypothetical protein